MRPILVAAVLVTTGCTTVSQEVDATTVPAVVVVPVDTWTGEVEWALVEECALHGLDECPDTVVVLRESGCSVDMASRYFREVGGGETAAVVIADLRASDECPGLTLSGLP